MTNEFEQAALAYQKSSLEWQQRYNIAVAERDVLRKQAEAAEAERDAAGLDLADAAQHIGRGDALRATLRAEIEAVRAQRDAIDKLWADAVAELSRVDDDRIQRVIERDMLRKACSLFVEWLEREDAGSGIQADERGTPAGEAKFLAWYHGNLYMCQVAVESARAALAVQPSTGAV